MQYRLNDETKEWEPAVPIGWKEEHNRYERFVLWIMGLEHCNPYEGRPNTSQAGPKITILLSIICWVTILKTTVLTLSFWPGYLLTFVSILILALLLFFYVKFWQRGKDEEEKRVT